MADYPTRKVIRPTALVDDCGGLERLGLHRRSRERIGHTSTSSSGGVGGGMRRRTAAAIVAITAVTIATAKFLLARARMVARVLVNKERLVQIRPPLKEELS